MLDLLHNVIRKSRKKIGTDKLGNPKYSTVEEQIAVAGWYMPSSSEPEVAGHDRLLVDIKLIAPSGIFKPEDTVLIPGYEEKFNVVGYPENYDHSPFGWAPGFEIVNLRHST